MKLAIDLGSTSFKAGVFDGRLRQVSSSVVPTPYRRSSGGRVELEVAAVEAALRRLIQEARPNAIDVIAVTSQAQTFTVLDRRGLPSRPFVSWQDTRADPACAALKKQLRCFGDHCSFGAPSPALQAAKLKHAPMKSSDQVTLTLPAYVAGVLTGDHVTDDNLAAKSGLYSLHHRDWWPAALKACGVRRDQLPRIVPVGSVAAETTREARRFGLPAGIPVVLAGNDQTAGAYAAALEQRRGVLLTLGTAQVAYRYASTMPQPHSALRRGPYPGGGFYQLSADACGANLLNWAETVLDGCNDHDRLFARIAAAPRGCHGLCFDLEAGGWRDLGLHHGPSDMARAILEALCARMAGMVRDLRVRRDQPLLVAGGGAQRTIWRRILSEALGRSVRRANATPLRGAARMAKEAVGR